MGTLQSRRTSSVYAFLAAAGGLRPMFPTSHCEFRPEWRAGACGIVGDVYGTSSYRPVWQDQPPSMRSSELVDNQHCERRIARPSDSTSSLESPDRARRALLRDIG